MDNDSTVVHARAARRRRYGTAPAVVALLGLLVAATIVVALALAPGHPAGSASPSLSVSAARRTATASRTPPVTKPPPTTTTTSTSTGPVRVLEIGDSLGVDLGEAMQSTWPAGDVQLTMAARGDTGLVNSAYYDWPTALSGLLASAHPQVVIALLGANDLQTMVTGPAVLGDGTPAWNAAYASRVTAIISESVRSGARVLWIGEPAMQSPFIDAGMTTIDAIAQRVVATYPGQAAYLSSDSVLAPGGSFTFDVDGPTGQEVQVRTPDGVHLMPEGADLLAAAAANELAATWGMHVAGP